MRVDHDLWMERANAISKRSNCIRRNVGAVIVKTDQEIAAGWNGVSKAYADCSEAGCPRCLHGGTTGLGYDECICVHAEQRAIADAAARGVNTAGATMYINLRPCLTCLAMVSEAGIRTVIFDEDWTYDNGFETFYQSLASKLDYFGRTPVSEALASMTD